MQKIQRTIDIKAPVQRVYDFVNQPNNLLSIWPNMVSVSNVVARPGGAHDFDWVFKMVGFHFKGHCAVEEAQSGKFARVRNESGIPSTFLWTYATNGSGTRLSLTVEYAMPTPVIGKIAEVLAAKINERDLDNMLANLKDVMEHGTTAVDVSARAPH
ncbi:MAG TPA: SRPBCC family protein [Polyangiaceae bacterium]